MELKDDDFVNDAWRAYLHACRDAGPLRYDEIEPWAWARLEQRLRLIRRASQRSSTKTKALA